MPAVRLQEIAFDTAFSFSVFWRSVLSLMSWACADAQKFESLHRSHCILIAFSHPFHVL
jgi:hypothetical protein